MPYKRYLYSLLLISSTLFSLSLDEAVSLGLEHNHNLATTALQTDIAASRIDESQAQHYGDLAAVASYIHYNTPRTLYPLTPAAMVSGAADIATTKDLLTTGLHYNVALFSGYVLEDSVSMAQLQKKTVDLQYRLGREELIYMIRNVYIDALAFRSSKEAWTVYTEAMNHLHANTLQEVTHGQKAPLELLKIDAERLKSETRQEELSAQTETLLSLLTLLTGSTKPITSLEEVTFTPSDAVLSPQGDSSRLAIAELAIETAKKNLHKSNASSLPQVGMEAYYGYSYGPNDTSNPKSGDWENRELWNVGVNVRWNITDFGKSSARKQQAKITQLQQHAIASQTALQVRHEKHEAELKFKTSRRQYILSQKQFELMEKTEEIELLRYKEGQIDMNDLLVQKADTQLALSEMITSRYSVIKNHYALEYLYEQGDSQ